MEEFEITPERRAIWRSIRLSLQQDAKANGVPFWNVDGLFHEICEEHLSGIAKAYGLGGYRLRVDDFVPMARRVTRIPLIRPDGASDEKVMDLARELCQKVKTLMVDLTGIPGHEEGNVIVFVAHRS